MSGSAARALLTDETRAVGMRQRDMSDAVDGPLRINEALVSFTAPASIEAEQYRALRHVIERLNRENQFQLFAVTSSGESEGKTITTLNLAGSLAQSPEARVLVIDADLHRPQVANYLGLARTRCPGLTEAVLYDDDALGRTVRRIDSLNLSVMLAGGGTAGTYELLTSPRLEEVLQDARRRFDYVLIDTPPVVPLADSRLLARMVDGYILVVAAHKTRRKLLTDALALMDPARIAAVVFNRDNRPLSPYYGYYGRYGSPAGSLGSSATESWWRRVVKSERP